MKIVSGDEIKGKEINMDGIKNVKMKGLITGDDGAPTFALRLFELGPEGCTPYHNHPWEHEVYILDGHGEVLSDKGSTPLVSGKAVFISPGETHQFRNTDKKPFKFLCIVPNEGHK